MEAEHPSEQSSIFRTSAYSSVQLTGIGTLRAVQGRVYRGVQGGIDGDDDSCERDPRRGMKIMNYCVDRWRGWANAKLERIASKPGDVMPHPLPRRAAREGCAASHTPVRPAHGAVPPGCCASRVSAAWNPRNTGSRCSALVNPVPLVPSE